MVNSFIIDMLICIKNGYISKLKQVSCRYNNSCLKILVLLCKYGYINGFYFTKTGLIVIKLKYHLNFNLFQSLEIVSLPSRRLYYDVDQLSIKFKKYPFVIVSNTQGIMLHRDAILKKLGGEVLFYLNNF